MKPIIKYISLLIFSGLILPFYNSNSTRKQIVAPNTKPVSAVSKTSSTNTVPYNYFIYNDIAEMLFPKGKN